MPTGLTRSPKLLKGALIKLSEDFLGPIPNIIIFQYNPEKMTRTLMPYSPADGKDSEGASKVQPYDPGEKFSLTLILDATDALEEPDQHPVAVIAGVADRISALEMLLYPVGDSLLGSLLPGLFGSGEAVPRSEVPVCLFAWGPGRILPVRLTSFSVEEQAYSPTLFPLRPSVTVGLQVLTDQAFVKPPGVAQSISEQLAGTAYKYTRGQRELLARANLANSVESIMNMLPF